MDVLLPNERKKAIINSHSIAANDEMILAMHPSDASLYIRSNPSPTAAQVIAAMLHPSSLAIRKSGTDLFRLVWNGSKECDSLVQEIKRLGGLEYLFAQMGIEQVSCLITYVICLLMRFCIQDTSTYQQMHSTCTEPFLHPAY